MRKVMTLLMVFALAGFVLVSQEEKRQKTNQIRNFYSKGEVVKVQEKERNQLRVKEQTQEKVGLEKKLRERTRQQVGFIDEDGDGINDLMQDHDNDGIPNCQDPDWTCPGDCTQQKEKHQFRDRHMERRGEKMEMRNCPHSSGTPEQQRQHQGSRESRHDNTHRNKGNSHGHDTGHHG